MGIIEKEGTIGAEWQRRKRARARAARRKKGDPAVRNSSREEPMGVVRGAIWNRHDLQLSRGKLRPRPSRCQESRSQIPTFPSGSRSPSDRWISTCWTGKRHYRFIYISQPLFLDNPNHSSKSFFTCQTDSPLCRLGYVRLGQRKRNNFGNRGSNETLLSSIKLYGESERERERERERWSIEGIELNRSVRFDALVSITR